MEGAAWLWLVVDIIGVAALAAALIYATMMRRHRRKDRFTEAVREEITRENYRRGG